MDASVSLAIADQDFARHFAGSLSIAGTTDVPFLISGLTNIRHIVLKAAGGASMVANLTSASGSVQKVPFGAAFVLRAPNDNPITALSIVGTGVLEYLVAGDL